MKKLIELKKQGYTTVYLNGFKESINYVMQLSDIVYVCSERSWGGEGEDHFFEQK